jgi:hypothetical protein
MIINLMAEKIKGINIFKKNDEVSIIEHEHENEH